MPNGGITSALPEHIHRVLSTYVDRGDVPGLVAAVSRHGDVHIDAIGSQSIGGDPIQQDTIFRISSMTKPITAVAAMILVDEGRLELDDPVDDFLPELADRRVLKRIDAALDETVPANRSITVRDLLTFRMGFGSVLAPPDTYPIQSALEELRLGQGTPTPSVPPEPDEWMRRFGTLPLIYQPGERWMYNTGSDVLGVLIARASNQPLGEFLSERLFEPLSMKDTAFSVHDSKINRLTTSYEVNPQTGTYEVYDPAEGGQWSRPPEFPSGKDGLVSTIDDYLAFVQMLLNNGQRGKTRILSRTSVELTTTNHLTPDQLQGAHPILESYQGWGFGLSVLTRRNDVAYTAGSYGWSGGMGTTWMSDPGTQTAAILLTQVNWASPAYPAISRDFLRAALSAIKS